jgi:hypothetical protein
MELHQEIARIDAEIAQLEKNCVRTFKGASPANIDSNVGAVHCD